MTQPLFQKRQKSEKRSSAGSALKVMSVLGTRPEAIKMAPVILGLQNDIAFESIVCVTAQHRSMLDQVLTLFNITPDFDLNLMQPGQDLFDITAKGLLGMRDVLRAAKPDVVLVHGDTASCFTAALAAFFEGIKVGHVEAGLRTGDFRAPFPEEANRSLVGRISNYHFAPTLTAKNNLLAENINPNVIFVTGNTVIDALLMVRDKALALAPEYWIERFGPHEYQHITDPERKLILITGHRRENFGEGFINLCNAIKELSQAHPDWDFIYPVHLNPNVQIPVNTILSNLKNVYLIAPQEYLPFVWLMNQCDLILTDSGGIQEEGPALGKPVLTMRDVTERTEALTAGTVKLVGTNTARIATGVEEVLLDERVYKFMSQASNPYGDGKATPQIISHLKSLHTLGDRILVEAQLGHVCQNVNVIRDTANLHKTRQSVNCN